MVVPDSLGWEGKGVARGGLPADDGILAAARAIAVAAGLVGLDEGTLAARAMVIAKDRARAEALNLAALTDRPKRADRVVLDRSPRWYLQMSPPITHPLS